MIQLNYWLGKYEDTVDLSIYNSDNKTVEINISGVSNTLK